MSNPDEAMDILVDSLFKENGVVVDSELASTMKSRVEDLMLDYPDGGELSAAIILLVASAINSALIPALDRWGAGSSAEILDKMLMKYKGMGTRNGGKDPGGQKNGKPLPN